MKRTAKTLLSLAMVLAMALTLLPLAAFADSPVPTANFDLSASTPSTGYLPTDVSAVNEYGYSVLLYTVGLSSITTEWKYTDEYGDHVLDPTNTFEPETVYTAYATIYAATGYYFDDPASISFEGAPATVVDWDSSFPYKVVVSYTYPATAPLWDVDTVRMIFDEPLYGANPDFTAEVEWGSSFEVDHVEWLDSSDNLLTAADVFGAGSYTLLVTVKPISAAKFVAPEEMTASFAEPAWHQYVEAEVALAANPNYRLLSYTWTVPEPVTAAALTVPQQAYGETPAMTASPEYWEGAAYYVKEVRWTDDTYTALASDEVFTNEKSYYAWLDVYPSRGNTFSSSLTATINGVAGTIIDKTDYVTVYAPVEIKAPALVDTVEIKLDPGVAVGNEKSWGEVAADADYNFDSITWYDVDDNELYDFHYELDHIYKAKIQISAGMGFAFDESANMKVLIDGEAADSVDVAGDFRSLTASKTYKLETPWTPVIGPDEDFDFTVSTNYGRLKEDFYSFAASMDALNAAGKISQTLDIDSLSYDLDMDGTVDVLLKPNTDPTYADIFLAETNSVVGALTLTLDATETDYLKTTKPAGYVETIKFLFPAPVEKYTVSFDAGGGTGTMEAMSVVKGEKFMLPVCDFTAPEGKVFDKWDAGAPGDEIEVTADMTLKALWKDKPVDTWTVSFDAGDGSGSMATQTVTKGEKFKLPECTFAAPAGKEFDKWDAGAPGDEIEVAADMTVKVLWKDKPVEKCTVSFDAGGGAGTMAAQTVTKGEKFKLPACAFTAPAGKEFDKWDAGVPGAEIAVTADMTVKALWKDKAPEKKANPFTDVAETDYFYDAVIWAYYAEPQVTNGIGNNLFAPNSTVKRCEAVTFLWRAVGCPEPTSKTNPFVDVTETDYFYKPVLWAVEKGITKGTDETHFTPEQTCSTAHIITFLYRSLGIGDDGWYTVAEAWAKGAGLLAGLDVSVAPGVDCPRRDVVLFLFRAVGK